MRSRLRAYSALVVSSWDAIRGTPAAYRRHTASPPGCAPLHRCGGRGLAAHHRQPDGEGRALAWRRLDSDPAAVLLDQLLGDREAQAGAAGVAVSRLVGAVEAVEDPVDHILVDADPGVGDADRRPVAGAAHGAGDRATGRRIAKRVVE